MPRKGEHKYREADLIGRVFGALTIKREIEPADGRQQVECECRCGKLQRRQVRELLKGQKRGRLASCKQCSPRLHPRTIAEPKPKPIRKESSSKTHGMTKHPLYQTWVNMNRRCHNPENQDYQYYGGRGIYVCDEWRDPISGLRQFAEDMGPKPFPDYSLERIDNNHGYSKANCAWASKEEQANNTRNVTMFEAFGEKHSLSRWARKIGVAMNTLHSRVTMLGMSIEAALSVPVKKAVTRTYGRTIVYRGKETTISELSKQTGVSWRTLYNRIIGAGWSVDDAIKGERSAAGVSDLVLSAGAGLVSHHALKTKAKTVTGVH